MAAQIAFIGQEQLLRVFTYFGVSVFQVSTPQDAEEKLRELVADPRQTWGIIYIEERFADGLHELIQQLNRKTLPVISIVSASGVTQGLARNNINALVRKATGVELKIEN